MERTKMRLRRHLKNMHYRGIRRAQGLSMGFKSTRQLDLVMTPDSGDQPGDIVLRRLDVHLEPEFTHGLGSDRADGGGEHLRWNREL